jgi:hypothetical protein
MRMIVRMRMAVRLRKGNAPDVLGIFSKKQARETILPGAQ